MAHRKEKDPEKGKVNANQKPNPYCWYPLLFPSIIVLAIICAILVVVGGILSGVYGRKTPKISVIGLSVHNFHISQEDISNPTGRILYPKINVTVRADNSNSKINFAGDSTLEVRVAHPDFKVGSGLLPIISKPSKTITFFHAERAGTGIILPQVDYAFMPC
ncbi:hypothetical protein FRX31_029798 [Thalictrum thalictroides]|uniref:Late embryogenesis abundant protein LEA-2 subgroup domain-containing protein n=1 Tax=Thalictrum thalictroides TaxID=46969 RepID=A0A7J6V7I6_THATH|nr:hypothetical protein FRX31_029798 [Thalictrum thalictroides]